MARSQRLRLRDARNVYLLLGECLELWADPLAWRTHAAGRLCALPGATVAMGGETRGYFGQPDCQIAQLWYVGMDEPNRRKHQRYMAERGYLTYDAPFERYLAARQRLLTRSHEQLTSLDEWHRSRLYNEFFRPFSMDDRLLSFCELPRGNGTTLCNCFTFLGDRADAFAARHRMIAHLFHRELVPLIGTRLATCGDANVTGLSRRLRQTLEHLLTGESEKQIARALCLSRPTVDQYVQALYRHFGASSRGELMAYFVSRRPHPIPPSDPRRR